MLFGGVIFSSSHRRLKYAKIGQHIGFYILLLPEMSRDFVTEGSREIKYKTPKENVV